MTIKKDNDIEPEESTSAHIDDEVVYDNDSDSSDEKIKKLQKKIKECEKEKHDYLDKWQRAQADVVNTRTQERKDKERAVLVTKERIISDLLPIIDSFDMAFSDTDAYTNAPETWRKGIESIYGQFINMLSLHNVTEFDPVGDQFDPSCHDAVDTQEVDNPQQDNEILSVLQKGYRHNESILRTARVVVGAYKEDENSQ